MKYVASKDMGKFIGDALLQVDRSFASRRSAITGANADIHQMKYLEAVAGGGPLIDAEAASKGIEHRGLISEVISRRSSQLEELATLEQERQAIQAKIRAATCPADISRVMKGIV